MDKDIDLIEGIKLINRSPKSDIYLLDSGRVLKLYKYKKNVDVYHEFKMAQYIYELGVPTAFPYEIVKIKSRSGILFEHINGVALSRYVDAGIIPIEKAIDIKIKLLKYIHKMPITAKVIVPQYQIYLEKEIEIVRPHIVNNVYSMIRKIINAIHNSKVNAS